MTRRHILLKEFGVLTDAYREPPDTYLAGTDGTLEKRLYRIRTDVDGYIMTEDAPQRDAPSVLFLGDSVVENYWVDEDKRICAVLQERLRQACDPRIRVLNAGMSGATLLHLINLFLTKGLQRNLVGVLIMEGCIDYAPCCLLNTFWTPHPAYTPLVEPEGSSNALPEPRAPDYSTRARLFDVLAAAADAFDLPLWIVTFPHRADPTEPWVADRWPDASIIFHIMDAQAAMNASTRDFALNRGRMIIDLEREFAGRPDLFYDIMHPNAHGCRILGEHICARIAPVLMKCLSARRGFSDPATGTV